jgi:hypothetical protein
MENISNFKRLVGRQALSKPIMKKVGRRDLLGQSISDQLGYMLTATDHCHGLQMTLRDLRTGKGGVQHG